MSIRLVQGHGTAAVAVVTTVIGLLMLVASTANAEVYKVGDSFGWTTVGNFDYKHWAATKNFHLGDVVVFQYNPQFHNVMQVNHAEYQSCNASSPIATHATGNDTIKITKYGHYFFLCGVPGHCQTGQKVDIHVIKPDTSPTSPSPSVASSPASASASASAASTTAPAPSISASSSLSKGLVFVIAAFLAGFPVMF